MKNQISTRDKAIIIGLYLSRFSAQGLEELGFSGFFNAYNVLGYAIGAEPRSIRGYRDEFDPYFPNDRKGWHKRTLRQHCKEAMDRFADLQFSDFTELIKGFLLPNYEVERILPNTAKRDFSASIARRLATGVAAEEYFKANYITTTEFSGFNLHDTRMLACGFDFKLTSSSNFYYVEVKGLNQRTGGIVLTEKEHSVASESRERYCLFVVRNFIEKPIHDIYINPLESSLAFRKEEKMIVQTSYSATIT